MKRKFKIMYPKDYYEIEKRGKPYHPGANCSIVMKNTGCFFLICADQDHSAVSMKKLSEVLYKYDVVWKD
tara:strand:- start:9715 stop:9924 length:210 start_codon:yes stop_codon:yes gene_type:complete